MSLFMEILSLSEASALFATDKDFSALLEGFLGLF